MPRPPAPARVLPLLVAALAVPASARPDASASSDLLHVLDADGRSYVLQHTVAADGPGLALELPGSVVPQRVLFMGGGRERWARRHARRPERISIGADGAGGALVRYRHQYGDEVVEVGDGRFVLNARSVPETLDVELAPGGEVPDFESVTAWVFPADVRVEAWRVEGSDDGGAGTWSFEDNVLTWSQRGLAAVTLEIEYRLPDAAPDGPVVDAGAAPDVPPAARTPVSSDLDSDGVPDVRDACIDAPGGDPTDAGTPGEPRVAAAREAAPVDELGCPPVERLVLRSIGFPTGRARLDLAARRSLDRLAAALGATDGDWEVAAHTDARGPESRNLALSLRRAESVRHYLMLRGVEPNRLVARGYGEAEPIADDASAAGRAANRRVELRRADPAGSPAAEGVGEDPPDGDR